LEFGRWLAERRREAGVNQRELARRCGLTPGYIANLERNTSEPPPIKTCKLLARALGTNFDEVWEAAFTARFRKWLKREGYGSIAEPELLDLLEKIKSANRRPTK